jgi:hypothetical protein
MVARAQVGPAQGGSPPAPPPTPSAPPTAPAAPAPAPPVEPSTAPAPAAPAPATPAAPAADEAPVEPLDAVVLTDGSKVVGHIIELRTGSFVTVRDLSGTERTIQWSSLVEVRPAHGAVVPATASAPAPAAPATPVSEPTPVASPSPVVTQRDHGYALEAEGTFDEAEKKRQDWKKRGGSLISYEFRGNAIFLTGGGLTGYGGGVGGRIAFLYLAPPDQASGSSTWGAFRLGVGYDWSYTSVSFDGMSSSSQTASLPFAVGANIGLGGFGDAESWSGVVLGASWAPSFTSSKISGQDNPTGTFNYIGFEVTLDFTTLDAIADQYAKKAHWRISAFLLPPVGSSSTFFATFGVGAVWY